VGESHHNLCGGRGEDNDFPEEECAEDSNLSLSNLLTDLSSDELVFDWQYTSNRFNLAWNEAQSNHGEHPSRIVDLIERLLESCFPTQQPVGFPTTGHLVFRIDRGTTENTERFLANAIGRSADFRKFSCAIREAIWHIETGNHLVALVESDDLSIVVSSCTESNYEVTLDWREGWGTQELGKQGNKSEQLAPHEVILANFESQAQALLVALEPQLKQLLVDSPPATFEEKRDLVTRLNRLFYAAGKAIKHPSLGVPTTLSVSQNGPRGSGAIRIRPTSGGNLSALPKDTPIELVAFTRNSRDTFPAR
jgi:hypothetical protein